MNILWNSLILEKLQFCPINELFGDLNDPSLFITYTLINFNIVTHFSFIIEKYNKLNRL